MATELSPSANRIRIGEPVQYAQEAENWSDPEFRNEGRNLKALMKMVLVQQQETRVKHNLLLESTCADFKAVHERKVMVENQFMRVGEKAHQIDVGCA